MTSTAVQNEQKTTVPAAAAASRGLAPAARFQTVPVTPTGFSQGKKKRNVLPWERPHTSMSPSSGLHQLGFALFTYSAGSQSGHWSG